MEALRQRSLKMSSQILCEYSLSSYPGRHDEGRAESSSSSSEVILGKWPCTADLCSLHSLQCWVHGVTYWLFLQVRYRVSELGRTHFCLSSKIRTGMHLPATTNLYYMPTCCFVSNVGFLCFGFSSAHCVIFA
jgi:hypothetical protein